MKVLHVSSGNLYGGVEALLATLSRERSRCPGMEGRFALCFPGRLSEELRGLGTPASLLGAVQTRFPWQVWLARRRLARLLREERFDAVVCHMAWTHAIFGPVARRAGVPLAYWMHDAANGEAWLERWAARCPPRVAICNSRWTAATVGKLFPRSTPPAEVVYCPVSPLAEPPSAEIRDAVRAEFDTPHDAVVIVQVGRLESYKGHAIHLDALTRLAAVPGWVCWIVGGAQRPHEHAYLDDLKARAAAGGIADRVRFAGLRTDVGRVLAAADLFCQPNVGGEPFGIVFVEALQAGLPVVATAIGGAREIVEENCGRLVPPADPDALADTLSGLMADGELRATLGGNGPARAHALSDPASVLGQLQACLSGLALR